MLFFIGLFGLTPVLLYIYFVCLSPFCLLFKLFVLSYLRFQKTFSTIGRYVKFVILNCKGLNNPIKRRKVLHDVGHHDTHVTYLQKTHLKDIDSVGLTKRAGLGKYATPQF